MTPEELAAELKKYYAFVNKGYEEKNGELLAERITHLNVLIGRTSEILVEAQYILDKARGKAAHELANSHTATVFREVLNARVADEARLYKHAERLNSAVKHQMDGIRSQLSYLKSFND